MAKPAGEPLLPKLQCWAPSQTIVFMMPSMSLLESPWRYEGGSGDLPLDAGVGLVSDALVMDDVVPGDYRNGSIDFGLK